MIQKFSGCETDEGNCNHDDECKQPGRRCGQSSVNVPDLPADTRLCEELPKCDITQWNDGKNILQSEELGSILAIMHEDQNLCSALPFSNFKNCGFFGQK